MLVLFRKPVCQSELTNFAPSAYRYSPTVKSPLLKMKHTRLGKCDKEKNTIIISFVFQVETSQINVLHKQFN